MLTATVLTAVSQNLTEYYLPVWEFLITEGIDINQTNGRGDTALMIAASKPERIILSFLMDKGSDPNKQDKQGRTALMRACEVINWDKANSFLPASIIGNLLENGAKKSLADKRGRTALDICISSHAPSHIINKLQP